MSRVISSWRFISIGGLLLLGLWLHNWGLDLIVSLWPPYQTASLTVVVRDGVPVKVIESRSIVTDFSGTWRVRVVDLERGEVRCTLPERGPRIERYRITDSPAYGPPWREYTGDQAGACITAMLEHPGVYEIRTQRTMRVLWRDVDLPPVVSAPFQVGG